MLLRVSQDVNSCVCDVVGQAYLVSEYVKRCCDDSGSDWIFSVSGSGVDI